MASPIFKSSAPGRLVPETDTCNAAGGVAYAMTDKHFLAQAAATGTFGDQFYTSAEEQLSRILEAAKKVDNPFLAKLALYSREKGKLKDMPALVAVFLTTSEGGRTLLQKIFPRLINNGRMLRNFVQILRSGVVGRKSLGSLPRRLVRNWLESRPDHLLFRDTVGNKPSIADVIKMVHPKPANDSRRAFYAYIIGKEHNAALLPEIVQQYEAYKKDKTAPQPAVDFRMLTALDLGPEQWKDICRNAGFIMTFKNLNTFQRHGVFDDPTLVNLVAARLKDREAIQKAGIFPYQLLMAYVAATGGLPGRRSYWSALTTPENPMPTAITEAIQDALDISIENVPSFNCKVALGVDTSGSMNNPITGSRGSATTAMRCVDVAGLIASTILRQNRDAIVLPFDTELRQVPLNPRDSVITNAIELAKQGGGGTNCSLPLAYLNRKGIKADLVIYASDNESWFGRTYGGTGIATEWSKFKIANPKAKLICIDLEANGTTQTKDNLDVLNVGGFSDDVFNQIAKFLIGGMNEENWVGEIEAISLEG